jgi:tetratricopeptide (TPR) repeat protein
MWIFPAGFLVASGAVIWLFRRNRLVLFGYGFFLLNIAGIVQFLPFSGAYEADRYTYLALFGIVLCAAYGFDWLLREKIRTASARRILLALSCLILIGCGAATWQRTIVWRNSFSLWTDAITKFPGVAALYAYRAGGRTLPDDSRAALDDYKNAIRLHPGLGIAYYGIGQVYALSGKPDSALPYFTTALSLGYQPEASLTGRGAALTALGQTASAIQDFTSAISLDSGYVEAYFNRANALLVMKDYRRAVSDLNIVIADDPDDAASLYNRGLAKVFLGDTSGGCADFDRSASLKFPAAESIYNRYCR